MKTLVFHILHGKSFNAQDFFIRQLVASGSNLFGLKFYAPWIMRLIKLRSSVNYQASARNHVVFLPEVNVPHEVIYPQVDKAPLHEDNAAYQSFYHKKDTSVMIRVCHSRSRFLSCMYIHDDFMTESR